MNDQYLNAAKNAVIRTSSIPLWMNEVYVVWFCKVLDNWKALVSTDEVDGKYWEVTYNGAKNETYVDEYHKHTNRVVKDGEDN